MKLDVIAMHGWSRDARTWEPWRRPTEPKGWQWQTGERGYGQLPPRAPKWSAPSKEVTRLVMTRSLGTHMLPAEILQLADMVVLLASFATFVPPGREGRRTRAALAGMAACLDDEARARTMLAAFTEKMACPQSTELLPPAPLDGPLDEANRTRLREDLDLLRKCDGLPAGFPRNARVLIVEAGEDRIVEPEARKLLREALPEADIVTLPESGHALLAGDVIGLVTAWVEKQRDLFR